MTTISQNIIYHAANSNGLAEARAIVPGNEVLSGQFSWRSPQFLESVSTLFTKRGVSIQKKNFCQHRYFLDKKFKIAVSHAVGSGSTAFALLLVACLCSSYGVLLSEPSAALAINFATEAGWLAILLYQSTWFVAICTMSLITVTIVLVSSRLLRLNKLNDSLLKRLQKFYYSSTVLKILNFKKAI